MAIQRPDGEIALGVVETPPPKKGTTPKKRGKSTGTVPGDAPEVKIRVLDNVAPGMANFFKETREEEKVDMRRVLDKTKLKKTDVDETFYLTEKERQRLLGNKDYK